MELAMRQHVKVLEEEVATAAIEKANLKTLYSAFALATFVLGLCAGLVVPI